MIYKTRGISLGFIKYKDSSIIAKIYTEKFGLQTYIVNSVRSARSQGKAALYQPLTLLDMVVYFKENRDINRISEAKCLRPFNSIPFDIRKMSIALYIVEILGKCLHHPEENGYLFEFLYQSVLDLDEKKDFENFHIFFLYNLTLYIGIQPDNLESINSQLRNEISFGREHSLSVVLLSKLNDLLVDNKQIRTNSTERRQFLYFLQDYYRLHFEYFGKVNSLKILNEVFH